jgi:uncharacterized metal-binding protein YceD (DUF177 family)
MTASLPLLLQVKGQIAGKVSGQFQSSAEVAYDDSDETGEEVDYIKFEEVDES